MPAMATGHRLIQFQEYVFRDFKNTPSHKVLSLS